MTSIKLSTLWITLALLLVSCQASDNHAHHAHAHLHRRATTTSTSSSTKTTSTSKASTSTSTSSASKSSTSTSTASTSSKVSTSTTVATTVSSASASVSFVKASGTAAVIGFPVIPPGTTANSSIANITTQCINAMEATVLCDDNLQSIASADYFLEIDNSTISNVCTASCSNSLAAYHKNVTTACAGQPQAWSGYPLNYFGDLFWASWNLTCLADSKTGQPCSTFFTNLTASYTTDVNPTTLPKSVLCSNCVLSMYQLFQATAYSYYDDIMASEWKNIQGQCGVTYNSTVPYNPTNVTNIPGFAPKANYTAPICFSGNSYTVASGDNCNAISQKYNVSTGALINVNGLFPDCSNLIGGASLCLPQACITYTVKSGDTCQGITNSTGISFTMFNSWNPTINSFCTNLIAGQQVCVGIPGTQWNGTTIAGATVTKTAVYATATAPAPSNIAYHTTQKCGKYYTVQSGDDCSLIALNNTISIGLFENVNPSINSNCTNLTPGLAYCVSPTADWNSTTSGNTTTTSTYVAAPAPTPANTTSNCFQWHTVVTNDYCGLIEQQYGITMDQLVRWNPSLNAACSNLILGDAYCVQGDDNNSGVSASATGTGASSTSTAPKTSSTSSIPSKTSTTSTSPTSSSKSTTSTSSTSTKASSSTSSSTSAAPSPQMSGTASNCNKYYDVVSGDSCDSVEKQFSITFQQLYQWNPSIGSNCQYLDVGYYYCVGVSS